MTAPGNRVPVAKDRRALQPYLRVQRVADKAILDELAAALRDAERHLSRIEGAGVGAQVRRDQIRANVVAIKREIEATWKRVLTVVFNTRGDAAAAAAEAAAIYESDLFRQAGPGPRERRIAYQKSLEAEARQGVDTLRSRLSTSRLQLAESVYQNIALSNGKIDRIVNSGLARGLSAKEIAQDVHMYIRPDVRGGVRYAAMRLARTELNNAFHAKQAALNAEKPWVEATKWNLSGSHPEPDACDDYAGRAHFNGGGPGEFRTGDVPPKPHPQCLCFLTPVMVEEREFISSLRNGAYDSYLSRYLG